MTELNTLALLKRGKKALEEIGWTQGTYARDVNGRPVDETDAAATCFCSWGALNFAKSGSGGNTCFAMEALDAAAGQSIVAFNDTLGRTKEEVLAKFDEAIAAEEAKLVRVDVV